MPRAAAERARPGPLAAIAAATPAGLAERVGLEHHHGLAAAGAPLARLGRSPAGVLAGHQATSVQTGQRRRWPRRSARAWLRALANW
jgi:hypothetical protein